MFQVNKWFKFEGCIKLPEPRLCTCGKVIHKMVVEEAAVDKRNNLYFNCPECKSTLLSRPVGPWKIEDQNNA